MDYELLRYIKNFDVRLREIERVMQETERTNRLFQRSLVRLEQHLSDLGSKVGTVQNHVSNQTDILSPLMHDYQGLRV